jgi:threonine aldolase
MAFPDGTADFRSDTVTRPSPEMLRAMAEAPVGDDAYGEDPTVNALEEEAAAAVGKESALFVPAGIMGNQIALKLYTRPGDDVLCVEGAHIRDYERGAASMISGVAFRVIPGDGGAMAASAIEEVLRTAGRFAPPAGLLAWENTHNASGGRPVPVDVMAAGTALARSHGVAVHLDGARLFNAAAASGVPAAAFTEHADIVMFCFSKGLGAPIGSALCGPADAVSEARHHRKRLGGGMRQAGVIAAAARIGLRDRDRLAEDHALAVELATALRDRLPDAEVAQPETNMVLVAEEGLPVSGAEFVRALAEERVLVGHIRPGVLRFCTHRDVDASDVARVADVAARAGR